MSVMRGQCVASATPDLRLPSQPQGITAHWLVPTNLYCMVTEAHVCCTQQWDGWDLNPQPPTSCCIVKFSTLHDRYAIEPHSLARAHRNYYSDIV